MWLFNRAVWTFILAMALMSVALVLLMEMLPGRPPIFLIALGAALLAVAVILSGLL